MRLTNSMTFVLLLILFLTPRVWAEKSNRNEVRENLSKGWTIIWGKNFTEADWGRGIASIAESIASYNPGPFLAWFEATWQENLEKIERNLGDVSRKQVESWIVDSLKQKKAVTYKGFKLEAGFATYNRWESVIYDEPRTRKNKKTGLPEVYTAKVEKKTSLPNWHQVYIRYQLKESGGHADESSIPKGEIQLRNTAKGFTDKVLDIDGDAVILGTRGSGTRWKMETDKGQVRLRNLGQGKTGKGIADHYLDVDGKSGAAILSTRGSGTYWKLETVEGGKVRLRNLARGFDDKYLDIDGTNGRVILSPRGSGTVWQIVLYR
jgi:hypothetical protein